MWSLWWVWIAGGFVIAIVETLVPGYIFLGFAFGAIFTGLLISFGMMGENLVLLILVFALASLASWLALRQLFGLQNNRAKQWTTDIND